MGSLRLLHWLGALLAAFGVVLIVLRAMVVVIWLTTWGPGPFAGWRELLYYLVVNTEIVFLNCGAGIAMLALGLFLWLWAGRELARSEQRS